MSLSHRPPDFMPLTAEQCRQQQQQMAVPVKAGIAIATGENLEQPCWSFTAGPSLYDTARATLDPPRFLVALNLNNLALPLPIRTALESLRAILPPESPPHFCDDDDPITPMLDLLLDETRCEYYSLDFSKRSATQTLNQVGINTFTRPLSELNGTVLVCDLERPIEKRIKAQLQDLRRLVRQF